LRRVSMNVAMPRPLLPVACALGPARESRAFPGNGLGLEAALDNAGVRLDAATVDEAGESHLALEDLVDHFSLSNQLAA